MMTGDIGGGSGGMTVVSHMISGGGRRSLHKAILRGGRPRCKMPVDSVKVVMTLEYGNHSDAGAEAGSRRLHTLVRPRFSGESGP